MSIPPWLLRNTHIQSGATIGGHANFFKESNGTDMSTTDLLALIDNLIYSLMSYTPDEVDGWADEEEYEERTQMKLKEVVPTSVFPL